MAGHDCQIAPTFAGRSFRDGQEQTDLEGTPRFRAQSILPLAASTNPLAWSKFQVRRKQRCLSECLRLGKVIVAISMQLVDDRRAAIEFFVLLVSSGELAAD